MSGIRPANYAFMVCSDTKGCPVQLCANSNDTGCTPEKTIEFNQGVWVHANGDHIIKSGDATCQGDEVPVFKASRRNSDFTQGGCVTGLLAFPQSKTHLNAVQAECDGKTCSWSSP